MRALVLAIVMFGAFGACGFQPGAASSSDGAVVRGDGSAAGDAIVHDTKMAGSDAPTIISSSCAVPDTTGLVLCLELDDASLATTAIDSSGRGHNAASNVPDADLVTRDVPVTSQAIQVTTAIEILVPDSTDFHATSYTEMAWVHREGTAASGGEYAVVDLGQQFAITVTDTGALGCVVKLAANYVDGVGAAVVANEWDLVGCTYDGANLCSYVFRGTASSVQGGCASVPGPVDNSAMLGIQIGSAIAGGSHLAGKLDSIRLFTRPLLQSEICAAGGLTGC